MGDMKKAVQERDLQPYHSFLAAFFAGFAELGLVNQGSMNIVSRRAAEYFFAYLEAKGILPELEKVPGNSKQEVVKNLILYINKLLGFMGGYELKAGEGEQVVLEIAANRCRICPKGVGGASVKGSLCPIPSFLENLINLIAGETYLKLVSPGIEKKDGNCQAFYAILD